MGGGNFLAGLQDAHPEHESVMTTVAPEKALDPLAAAFLGHQQSSETITDFAQALGGTETQTETPVTFGTEDLAYSHENQPAAAETQTATTEFADLFGLAQRADLLDQKNLLELRQEIETHKAELISAIAEAEAQDPLAAQNEKNILLAQETGNEGIYYVNFLHQARITVEHYIKLLKNLITNSAGAGAGWLQTRDYHNRQRDELKLQAQAAG